LFLLWTAIVKRERRKAKKKGEEKKGMKRGGEGK